MILCANCGEVVIGDAYVLSSSATDRIVHHECEREMLAKLAGRTCRCPMCGCQGEVDDRDKPITDLIEDKEATAQGGFFAQPVMYTTIVGFRKKPCPLCDGIGYVKEMPLPIQETKTVGRKKSEPI